MWKRNEPHMSLQAVDQVLLSDRRRVERQKGPELFHQEFLHLQTSRD